jgi:cephalosporin-C deacetylase-like acetyl esterase
MVLLLVALTSVGAAEEIQTFRVPVPAANTPQKIWDTQKLFATPASSAAEITEGAATPEIRAVFYPGEPFRGSPTRVFAWIGIPAKRTGQVPGIVLVHGGGGTAFRDWVKRWVDRGYAAIAMDTCGTFLTSPRTNEQDRQRNEFSGPPGWGGFDQVNAPVADQWMYHAVAAVIRGHSLLRSQPGVDPARIGLTGISWGGIITGVVAGVDARFRFAAPVYGCGFLGENSFWLTSIMQNMERADVIRWLTLWDPSQHIGRAGMPMLFTNGTNDKHFRPDSWQKTYRTKPGARTLSLKLRMPHGHAPAGDPPEITMFADSLVRGGPALPRIVAQGREDRVAWVTYASPTPVTKATLLYTEARGDWVLREWQSVSLPISDGAERITVRIPSGATAYYLNLADSRGCIVSSEHEELD